MRDERRDPETLRRLLIGGRSSATGRRYPGLGDRVADQVRRSFAVPRPSSSSGRGSIIGPGAGRTAEPDGDPAVLARWIARWLRQDPVRAEARSGDPDVLVSLVKRATNRAAGSLRGKHVRDRDVTEALELSLFLIGWLKARCEHPRARDVARGQATECPDCGAVQVG